MPIIEVNHVTKEYRLGHMKSLKQSVQHVIDSDLVDFTTTIPPTFKVKPGKNRHIFKQAVQEFLPLCRPCHVECGAYSSATLAP